MCHNGFTMKINLSKYKRFKDGGCAYSENTGSSHLNGLVLTYLLVIACLSFCVLT